MVRRFLAFRTSVPSERYGRIASKYAFDAATNDVRVIPGPLTVCQRGKEFKIPFVPTSLPGSARVARAVSSLRALSPTGLGPTKSACRGSCSTFASVLSPSTLAEEICRYGGIEVWAWGAFPGATLPASGEGRSSGSFLEELRLRCSPCPLYGLGLAP